MLSYPPAKKYKEISNVYDKSKSLFTALYNKDQQDTLKAFVFSCWRKTKDHLYILLKFC